MDFDPVHGDRPATASGCAGVHGGRAVARCSDGQGEDGRETAHARGQGDVRAARKRRSWSQCLARSKAHRGFRRFLLRGLAKVRGEWCLVCLTHNLLKIWRYGRSILGGSGCAVIKGRVEGVV